MSTTRVQLFHSICNPVKLFIKLLFLLVGFVHLFSCQPKPKNPNPVPLDSLGSNKDIVSNRQFQKEEVNKILRSFPTSYQLALLFAKESKENPTEYLKDIEETDFYSNDVEKALALGAYQTDLAFAVVSGEKEKFNEYFDAVNHYSGQLGIPVKLDESLKDSINTITGNDSLIYLFNKLFINMDLQLKTEVEQELAILIITSAWLESMYLGIEMMAEKTEGYKKIIAGQKGSLNQLLQLKNSVENEKADDLYSRMEVLAAIYEKVEVSGSRSNNFSFLEGETVDSNTYVDGTIKMSNPVLHAIENEVEFIRRFISKQKPVGEINN